MASITNRVLTIKHDHKRHVVHVKVTCNVNFSGLELCQIRTCPEHKMFKLKCQLWGDDPIWDDFLYTFPSVLYLPSAGPVATETAQFEDTVGEGLLDEDWIGKDEVYGKLILYNLAVNTVISKNTNVIHHSF